MYEQIFVLFFLILGNKTFVESRCAKVSTHEDIITVEMCVQRKPMNNQNSHMGHMVKMNTFGHLEALGVGASIFRLGPSWFISML